MGHTYSDAQKNRLTTLGVHCIEIEKNFDTTVQRDAEYKRIEKAMVADNRRRLLHLTQTSLRPKLPVLQENLTKALCDCGFTQVTTPTTISRRFLEKMSIEGDHPLLEQVYWLDKNSCLRPMLAPNLYEVSRKMMNYCPLPLKLFEIGSCFRRESEGRSHLSEFTMLNLVEWGLKEKDRIEKLKDLSAIVLEAAQINDFGFEEEDSVVYGMGLDVIGKNGIELASTSMGPHRLDAAWKINCTWVGLGFGLERLLMYREGDDSIHRHGKSLSYQDGALLNIK